jgi:glutaredoxin
MPRLNTIMRHLRFFLAILIVVVHIGGVAYGEIYKWVDKNGVMHYGDVPPQGVGTANKIELLPATPRRTPEPQVTPDEERKTQTTNLSMQKSPPPEAPVPVMADANVEMFATRWCGYCKKAREFFQARGIAITEYDIEADATAAQRKQEIYPSPGVPLVVINGKPIQGFTPHAYEQALQAR